MLGKASGQGDSEHSILKREAGAVKSQEGTCLLKGQAGRGFDGPLGGMTVAMTSQKQLALPDIASLQDSVGNNRDPFLLA